MGLSQESIFPSVRYRKWKNYSCKGNNQKNQRPLVSTRKPSATHPDKYSQKQEPEKSLSVGGKKIRKLLFEWVGFSHSLFLFVNMEAPDTAACFVDDLLDFASDIGEEDDEDAKPRKALPPLNSHGHGPLSFGLLHPNDPGLPYPVSSSSGPIFFRLSKHDEFAADSGGFLESPGVVFDDSVRVKVRSHSTRGCLTFIPVSRPSQRL